MNSPRLLDRTSNPPLNSLRTGVAAICALAATMVLSGCGMGVGGTRSTSGTAASTLHVSGSVHGGQQPVSGATIQLYTVGTTGLASAATPMVGSTATTLADGSFNLNGLYNCSSPAATQVYITATGGNPGAGTNSALTLVAALGSCASLTNATFVVINEVTTVAAAYALAPFSTDILHVGATGSNPTGLVNAFTNAAVLADTSVGTAGGASLGAGVTVPVSEINTLANIIAACVNTTGAASAPCTSIFAATGATETFGAALAIAKNPGAAAVTALFNLPQPAAPFAPTLTAQPADFTVAISTNAAGTLSTPYAIAIDAAGNAWVANESGSNISELAVSGNALGTQTATGLSGAQGIAVDRSGNVWVANTAGNSVIKFAVTAGAVTGSTSFTGSGISAPSAIAIDSANNAFIANFNGNSVTELSNAGVNQNGSPFTGSANNILVPTAVAVGSTGGPVYVTSGTGAVVKLSNTGVYQSTATDGALQGPVALAVNGAGQIGVTGYTTGNTVLGALSEFTDSGSSIAAASGSPISSNLAAPAGIASDGTSFWVVTGSGLGKYAYGATAATSTPAGYGALNTPIGVAVDASGSVWVTVAGSNAIAKFIGLAVPTTTPLAANVGP